ncbi:MAG: hypothetical protein WC279_03860 [Sulfurimonas sp.]|jgi:hypothetical protein|uniref:hypothetical protein n=1 Tax=unclassified Sulfurimonas TaxID=2623549 RepID=UPI0008C6F063|nr:hypothetical protein [Sulfurimonas sp. RIFOXYB12_FULL_35_9]OHE04732.1 MAG: hypothetical protein A2345_02930 [Sulfurimonas sp. RIFOXYB12_FULL_35_9]OHE11347.1 MAG: hypothetical protein A2329_03275 [Sulfurimonas sp. RIFOXYB2_FULL_37_5]
MRRILSLSLVMAIGFFAAENLPMSPKVSEGKSVYTPTAPSVNIFEERNIQKQDQNSTKHSGTK